MLAFKYKVWTGLPLVLFVAAIWTLVTALTAAIHGDTSRAIYSIVFCVSFATAAYFATSWLIEKYERQKTARANALKSLVYYHLRMVEAAVRTGCYYFNTARTADGRLPSTIFSRMPRPSLQYILTPTVPLYVLAESKLVQVKYLNGLVSAYNHALDHASSMNTDVSADVDADVPPALERQIRTQLDHLRSETAATLRLFADDGANDFAAAQLERIALRDSSVPSRHSHQSSATAL